MRIQSQMVGQNFCSKYPFVMCFTANMLTFDLNVHLQRFERYCSGAFKNKN